MHDKINIILLFDIYNHSWVIIFVSFSNKVSRGKGLINVCRLKGNDRLQVLSRS